MSYKANTREMMLDAYHSRGLEYTIALGITLLKSDFFKKDAGDKKTSVVFGEIGEAVLEACVIDYIKRHKLQDQWFFEKSLILKDLDSPNSRFLTEVDFSIFTPYKICVVECKNYKGDKVITGKGIITRSNREPFDVFSQHRLHMSVFTKIFDGFRKPSPRHEAYQALVFDFSTGSLRDNREEAWKFVLPFVNHEALVKMLDHIRTQKVRWDMKKLRKVVDIIARNKEALTREHIDYVSSLRDNKGESN